MRLMAIFVCWAALMAVPTASMGQGEPVPKSATPLLMPPPPLDLPNLFDGWTEAGQPQTYTDAAQADAANAAALKEYGFERGVEAAYKRDGETLTLLAMRFGDVSGAVGAYTYYRQ